MAQPAKGRLGPTDHDDDDGVDDDDDGGDDDHQKTTEANIIGRHPWLRTLPRATAWLIMIIMMIIDKW